MVHLLINHPTFNSINEKNKYGRTALHYGEYLNIFKLIISFVFLFKATTEGCDIVVHLLINHLKCNVKFLGQWKKLEYDDFKKGMLEFLELRQTIIN